MPPSRQEKTGVHPRTKIAFLFIGIAVLALVVPLLFFVWRFNTRRVLSANEIANLSASVLTLYVYDENHDLLSTGSGFIAIDDRALFTNYHVIDQGYFIEAVSEKDIHYPVAGVRFYDEDTDIAVLHLESSTGLQPLTIRDSSTAKVGDTIYAIGSPLGLKNTVSNGIISAIRDEDIQITAPISSGSSGGALLNIYGEIIGIPYASYSEGQNLNLAVPSAEFRDKAGKDTIQKLADVVAFAAPLGNSIENYSALETRLVPYKDTVYESYNVSCEIISRNVATDKKYTLGIHGTNLSVFRDILYYVSPDKGKIGAYNLSTGEACENILLNYPSAARVEKISKLFITRHGITVMYSMSSAQEGLIQLDFDGNIIGRIEDLPDGMILADPDLLVGCDGQKRELVFYTLPELKRLSLPLDFKPDIIRADSKGNLYMVNKTELQNTHFIKYNIYEDTFTRIKVSAAGFQAYIYGCSVFQDTLYYPTGDGTVRVQNAGEGREILMNQYRLHTICYDHAGKLYAIGSLPSESSSSTIKYYLQMNLDGTQVEILHIGRGPLA